MLNLMILFSYYTVRLFGWRMTGELPQTSKFVMIAAPHTSNWDLLLMLGACHHFNIRLRWMGKHTLFQGLFGKFMLSLGGLPIERSKSHNMVEQVAQQFNSYKTLMLAVPPEGTRSKTERWKSGFYYIAKAAKVPVVCGYLDYENKVAGIGPSITITDDLEKDMKAFQNFYAPIKGKYPEKQGAISIQQPQ